MKQDARKTRHDEYADGSVLIVHEQGARSHNDVFRSSFFILSEALFGTIDNIVL